MGILDKLKGRKKEEPKAAEQASEAVGAPTSASAEPKSEPIKGDTGRAYQILIRPIVTEKATTLASSGKYIFEVNRRANKPEIKKSVQKVYSVHVTDVKILNVMGKSRRYGKAKGETSAYKKALVTLKAGEKITGIIESIG